MLVLAPALLLDWYFGEPEALWRRFPHPVVLFGRIISWVDHGRFNQLSSRTTSRNADRADFVCGIFLIMLLLVVCAGVGYVLHVIGSLLGPLWWVIDIVVVSVLVAQRSLWDHVNAVKTGLANDGVEGGRKAVSMIVGRDVSQLNESGVLKAALESLAENFSDGVVAPSFWYLLFGLPGILFYKAVNTADSMIGHRNEKYEYFGKPTALFDDVLNWPAARISALLVVMAVALKKRRVPAAHVWNVTLSDASQHRSPNAGWPETAFAASLGVALGGPRQYGDTVVNASVLNGSGRVGLKSSDLTSGLNLFRTSCFILIGLCLVFGLFF